MPSVDWLALVQHLPQVATIFFVGFFLAVLWYVFRDPRPGHAERMRHLPLSDQPDGGEQR